MATLVVVERKLNLSGDTHASKGWQTGITGNGKRKGEFAGGVAAPSNLKARCNNPGKRPFGMVLVQLNT